MNSNKKTEKIKEINNILNTKKSNLKVIDFIDSEYKDRDSKTIVECKIHGIGCYFGNPWNPAYRYLKDGAGCPKCLNRYVPETKEAIQDINKLINPDLNVVGFVDGKYITQKSKTIVECKIHGKGCDFDNPWNPEYRYLKEGAGCRKCAKQYVPTTKEAIQNINKLTSTNINVIGFIGGEYEDSNSRTIVECKTHGKGCDFDTPWNPPYYTLKKTRSCPKCAQQYIPTTKEAINIMNNIINPNLKLIDFLDGQYKDSYSKTIVECKIHGRGCNFHKPWNPSYFHLRRINGCPQCFTETHDISSCLKNIKQFNNSRNIYFITFKNLKNNEIFYKIGVSTEKGYKMRYKKLKKDNVEIIEAKEITTNNILALLTEYYVLTHFREYKKYMLHVLKTTPVEQNVLILI